MAIINAKEAARRTMLNSKLKGVINEIEKAIDGAVEGGRYEVSIAFPNGLEQYLADILSKELTSLGYKFKFEQVKTNTKWDFNSYLNISWSDESAN